MHNKGQTERVYHSIFGAFRFRRRKYHNEERGSYYPLDAALNLPTERHSYLLQSWMARAATAEAFEPSLSLLNDVLSQDFKAMTAQRISARYGAQVEAYYGQKPAAPEQGASWACAATAKASALSNPSGIRPMTELRRPLG